MGEGRTCSAPLPTAGLRWRQTLSALPARMVQGHSLRRAAGPMKNYCCPGSNCVGARACALACGGSVDTGLRAAGAIGGGGVVAVLGRGVLLGAVGVSPPPFSSVSLWCSAGLAFFLGP